MTTGLEGYKQTTIGNAIRCLGVGLHGGKDVTMVLRPAPANTGIVFVRTDIADQDNHVPARFDAVSDTMLGTTVVNAGGVKVATIEHLMAALAGYGIDNVYVDLDAPEVPIMDGSSAPFVFLLECAGVARLDAPRRAIRVLKSVRIEDEDGKLAELLPADGFSIDFEIAFNTKVIDRQRYRFDFSAAAFKTELCRARTFGFLREVEYLRANGLALGGSLENSIVIDGDQVLNEGGLRYADEFVRHKTLDAIGDLALAGAPLVAHYRAIKAGHGVNNRMLRALFADETAWEWVTLGAEDVAEAPAAAETVPQRARRRNADDLQVSAAAL